MHPTRQEQLTAHFYEWELRGRGWMRFAQPVELEGEFHPFHMHRLPQPYIDDGTRHTWASSIAEWFRAPPPVPAIPAPALPPIQAYAADTDAPMRVVGISFAQGVDIAPERMEHLFVMLSQCGGTMSFEIIATQTDISLQLACCADAALMVRGLLAAYVPEAIVHDSGDRLQVRTQATYVTDFGLAHEFMRPLAMRAGTDHDPYIPLVAFLDLLQPGEQVVIQILFAGTVNPWAESIMRSVTINGRESFFEDAPEMPALAAEKVSKPLLAATVRAFAQAADRSRASMLLRDAATHITTMAASAHNALMPLGGEDYRFEDRIADIVARQSHRLGMLLNVSELATIAHFPSGAIRSPKLLHARTARKAPPFIHGSYRLGMNVHHGIEQPVYVPDEKRFEHIVISGVSGQGKSTLLLSLICQDIASGNGCAVIDPHGDLVDAVLAHIPEHRVNDVVLIDPADAEYPVGFNLLRAHSVVEKELLASDLVALFRRYSSSWGDQMGSVLSNAILAILESTQGGTLIDLRRFLIEKPFRAQVLTTVTDEAIRYYWTHEYPLLKTSSIGSILTRLDTFLRPRLIRNMVSQQQGVDMAALMDSRKIILVKLAQGLIGEENSYLLGTAIVSKIQQTAINRQVQAQRVPFYAYIDEFHHFLTPSMASLLTGVRKYAVGLILAHQNEQQLARHGSDVGTEVLGSAGTRICFRLLDADAKHAAEGFASFTADDIRNLERGEAIVRIGRAQDDCIMRVLPVSPDAACNMQERIIAQSRATYAARVSAAPPRIVPAASTEPEPPQTPTVIAHDVAAIERAQQQKRHRYLQTLVKKLAEERGYTAHLELPTADGRGRVDVALSKDDTRIAVELSVTTKADWELHNIRKCLADGYESVIACSEHPSMLRQLRARISAECTAAEQARIRITDPDHIADHLPLRAEPVPSTETRMKGYRVSVSYGDIDQQAGGYAQRAGSRVVREAVQKKQ